jgi:hypothetical protein
VTKHFQQDEGTSQSPSHDMTIIQSVSYRDRSQGRETTLLAYTQELWTRVKGTHRFFPSYLLWMNFYSQVSLMRCVSKWMDSRDSHWTRNRVWCV